MTAKKILFFSLFLHLSVCVFARDNYKNFAQLRAENIEGVDYLITAQDRRFPFVFMVIHGGAIEQGTKEIGQACAENDWNLYVFEALGPLSKKLHITSANFDEPLAVAMATSAVVAVSIHRQKNSGDAICIGGGNERLAKDIAAVLAENGFKPEQPCKRLPGKSKNNIVNRTKEGGVQLELSSGIIKKLQSDVALREKFCAAVRSPFYK